MTDLRQAAQQALEALHSEKFNKAVTLLRKALEQPEQQAEPFSAVSIHATQTAWKMGYEAAKAEMQPEQEPVGMVKELFTNAAWNRLDVPGSTKVYLVTPPAAQREWQGLTDEEFLEACQLAERGNYLVAFQRIQIKLKEKNT
jgi:hypothetical protein